MPPALTSDIGYRFVERQQYGVYPRACGETFRGMTQLFQTWGLSPRMRGNLEKGRPILDRHGSIPTHAGKPKSGGCLWRSGRVYPHACGETLRWEAKEAKKRGLSPRMRGNRAWTIRGNPWHGSIPTHAGKPRSDLPTPSQCRVYPHACGETFTIGLSRKALRGLSPRMRGNQLIGSVQGGRVGSIPTHAGKPRCGNTAAAPRGVYPHACGET